MTPAKSGLMGYVQALRRLIERQSVTQRGALGYPLAFHPKPSQWCAGQGVESLGAIPAFEALQSGCRSVTHHRFAFAMRAVRSFGNTLFEQSNRGPLLCHTRTCPKWLGSAVCRPICWAASHCGRLFLQPRQPACAQAIRHAARRVQASGRQSAVFTLLTRIALGSAARTKIPMACCGSICPKVLTLRFPLKSPHIVGVAIVVELTAMLLVAVA